MRWVTIVLMSVVIMTGGLMYSDNHGYQVSFGSSVGNVSSISHNYDILSGIPSTKNVDSPRHEYQFGMFNPINISRSCMVTSGSGYIISQTGTNVNVTLEFNNIGINNITCNLVAVNGQCSYLATNISYITIPYTNDTDTPLLDCEVVMTTNVTTNIRNIKLQIGYIPSDWGKIVTGITITISLIGIYIGWKKISEDL